MAGKLDGMFAMRFVQMVFAIIAFACVAEWNGIGVVDYYLFTGIMAMIICLALMACYLMGVEAVRGLPSFIVDVLWCIFWLVAAAWGAAEINDWGGGSRAKAADAFAWLSWFLWIASSVMSFLEMRGKGGVSVRVQQPQATVTQSGAPPTGAMAMV